MSFDPEKITFFAKTDTRGRQIPFGIKAKDRQRHMYVVGKTGMGKSTLLENMAAQDIANGEGMAFIDPHGSAAETLLDYVPEHRVNDVIYFAPFDTANPISFNVMEDVDPDKRHLVVSGLMSTFMKIWVDAWSARMEYILTNALLALIEYPDTTLLSVNRLFSDKNYRNQVVAYIKDPAVKAFWTEEFANYTDRFAAEALPAIQNKIGQFTGNPLIRNIIGQPHSSFDIRTIMDEKKILIMNLSKGLIGETNANLLGSMLTTRIYLAAMSRADLPVNVMKTMPNFYFYVDEFQSFANATFANILSEARKYHLNLIIAHQYIAQMEEEVRDAVFGNVGTTVAFRVGPFDAEVLETVFTPRFLAADLVNLGFAQIYLTLMIDGIGSQPFSAVTLPPVQYPQVSCKDMVIAASRRNYTKDRETVDKLVTDLHTPVAVEKPPVKKKSESGGGGTPRPMNGGGNGSGNGGAYGSGNGGGNSYGGSSNGKPADRPPQRPRENPVPQEERVPTPQSALPDRPRAVENNTSDPVPRQQPPLPEREARTMREQRAPRESREPARSERDKSKPPVTSPALADLRSVLASISAKENSDKSRNSESKTTERSNQGSTEETKNKVGSPTAKLELASALAQVQASAPPSSKEESLPSSKQRPDGGGSGSRPSQPIKVESQSNNQASTSAGADQAKAELARLVAETEQAFASLDNSQVANDPLAPNRIEKMFKSPGNERSPFAT